MSEGQQKKYRVDLNFESVSFPPINDILVLGNQCPQGKKGLYLCFELMAPGSFELIEIEHPVVEAVLINKKILKKMDKKRILNILEREVFSFLSENEILNVKFNITISVDSIKGSLD
jgi:hypothetical protein